MIFNNFFSCLRALSNLCALASSFFLLPSVMSFFNSLRRSLVSSAVAMMLLRTTFLTSASSATGISSVRFFDHLIITYSILPSLRGSFMMANLQKTLFLKSVSCKQKSDNFFIISKLYLLLVDPVMKSSLLWT